MGHAHGKNSKPVIPSETYHPRAKQAPPSAKKSDPKDGKEPHVPGDAILAGSPGGSGGGDWRRRAGWLSARGAKTLIRLEVRPAKGAEHGYHLPCPPYTSDRRLRFRWRRESGRTRTAPPQ